jgi:rRNA maturation protein Nop10
MATLAQDRKIPFTWKPSVMFGCKECGNGNTKVHPVYYDPDDNINLHTICPECGEERSIPYSEIS